MILPLGIQKRRGVPYLIWLGGALADYLGPVLCKEFIGRFNKSEFESIWKDICLAIGNFDAIVLGPFRTDGLQNIPDP
jgi:hypothetical protein